MYLYCCCYYYYYCYNSWGPCSGPVGGNRKLVDKKTSIRKAKNKNTGKSNKHWKITKQKTLTTATAEHQITRTSIIPQSTEKALVASAGLRMFEMSPR